MVDTELLHFLHILYSKNLGFAKLNAIFDFAESADLAFSELAETQLPGNLLGSVSKASAKNLEIWQTILQQCKSAGVAVVPRYSLKFPRRMEALGTDAAPLFFARGRLEILQDPAISIIGWRESSQKGLGFAQRIANMAAQSGKTVVSGMAKGADSAAMQAAMESGGNAVGVLANGIFRSRSRQQKWQGFVENGQLLLLSAWHPKSQWLGRHAILRNAQIRALGDAMYVAESNVGGGTWQTAIAALKAKHPVFVPFFEKSANNANNLLIAQGLQPVDQEGLELADILPKGFNLEKHLQQILSEPCSAKEVAERFCLPVSAKFFSVFLAQQKSLKKVQLGNQTKWVSLNTHQQLSLFWDDELSRL